MKKGWLKRILTGALVGVLGISSLPVSLTVLAEEKETIYLSGTITDDDQIMEAGNYALSENVTFSGTDEVWAYAGNSTIDLCGHKLTLDGVTLSTSGKNLTITDSVGGGILSSDQSQIVNVSYDKNRYVGFDNITINYTNEELEDVIPLHFECGSWFENVTIHTSTDYALYVDDELTMYNTSIWGIQNAEILLGADGVLGYYDGWTNLSRKVKISLKNIDFSESNSKALVVDAEETGIPTSYINKITFIDVPEDSIFMTKNGDYCLVNMPTYELAGTYDVSNLELPNTTEEDKENDKYNWNSGYYKLTSDVTLKTPVVSDDYLILYLVGDVVLDLNGHTMDVEVLKFWTRNSSLTVMDSASGGELNGNLYFQGNENGAYTFLSGTVNSRGKHYGGWPTFNLFGTSLTIDGGIINCYHTYPYAIQAGGFDFNLSAGEFNYYNENGYSASGGCEIMMVDNPLTNTINISGGTLRSVAAAETQAIYLLGGKVNITGGEIISEYVGNKDSEKKISKIIKAYYGQNCDINISGGRFITNGESCFDGVNGSKGNISLSGNPVFESQKYDISFDYANSNPLIIKNNFDIGRKLTVYTSAVPTEENVVTFATNWTKNRGDQDPADYLDITLSDGNKCTPVVSDGNVISGEVCEPEPEYIDGLPVYELSGIYKLRELELPNTAEEDAANYKYTWGNGYYRLTEDVTIETELSNQKGKLGIVTPEEDVVIDLNGHKLNIDPLRFNTEGGTSYTIVDSAGGGEINGLLFMWGGGEFNLNGGTINASGDTKDLGSSWMFNIWGGTLNINGTIVNCYHDSDIIMIQMSAGTLNMNAGELNYLPTTPIPTWHEYLLYSLGGTINVTGGTMRMEASDKATLIDAPDAKTKISGGKLIAICNDETATSAIANSRVIVMDSSSKTSVEISGGEFVTNGDSCFESPLSEKTQMVFSGSPKMTAAKYDVSFTYADIYPITVKSDFDLGRKMKLYSSKAVPSEENIVTYVKDWTTEKGNADPAEYFEVYLSDDTTRVPYTLDGGVVCGGVFEDEETLHETGDHSLTGDYELESQLPDGFSKSEETAGRYEEEPELPAVKQKNATAESSENKGIASEKVNTSADGTAAVVKVTSNKKSLTVGSEIVVNGVTYEVTTIEKNAFKSCKKLKTVSLPDTVEKISARAFSGAKNLKTIKLDIAKSIKVEKGAFKGLDTTKITIQVGKDMSKKELKKFKKVLQKAGFKGTVERKL